MTQAPPQIRIGTSGWVYPHWRDAFYPAGLPQADWLRYYAARLHSVEINGSFYRLPGEAAVADWCDEVSQDFVFAVKASRYITHMKKLREPEATWPPFIERMAGLGKHLGPILFQLPPRWRVNLERLQGLLEALGGKYRAAFEFRDPSWFDDRVYALLEKHGAALCIYELAGFKSPHEVTADFVYLRLHGPSGAYQGCYSPQRLSAWARRLHDWQAQGRGVYCYFDNDEAGYAAHNALQLQRYMR
ncbi:MAG: DUF72 domain-containing protein [Gammaproteobacteria bacterium]|jgi:uncharacterized protein YecE (DUF72 family)